MSWQCAECRQVSSVPEDIAGGRLFRVGKKLELVPLALWHEVTARRARCGTS